MTDIYYLFLLLSLMIYYVTEISIFPFYQTLSWHFGSRFLS